jgi:ribosomal protein S27E
VRTIALKGKNRLAFAALRSKANIAVHRAIRRGKLIDLKKTRVKCSDCEARATQYDHRDYNKPLAVEPVCQSCNIMRGTNAVKTEGRDPQLRCPNCNRRSLIYFRSKTKDFVCRLCGAEWKRTL